MNWLIFDGDTFYDINIRVKDYELKDLWRKWKPIENEDNTDVEIKDEWNIKQKAAGEMRKNKVKILEGVYYTYYEKYSLLVNIRDGKVYHFNNRDFNFEVEGQEIYLRKIGSQVRECVYKYGVFYPTKGNWLIESSQRFSKNECVGIGMSSDLYGSIKIKDHQIVAAMLFGQEAIELTMGENPSFQINHRNLENEDNRPENLEIVTNRQNAEHRMILNRFRHERLNEVIKELGIVNFTIINKRKFIKR
jgi:hypothetical protein